MARGEDGDIALSSPIFYLLLGAAGVGGLGVGQTVNPQRGAVEACFDNSRTALTVAAQHGEELKILSAELNRLSIDLNMRTRFRYTAEDATKDKIEVDKRISQSERRLDYAERFIDDHESKQHKGK